MSNEKEIKEKGLNAPRLTPESIDSVIVSEDYHVFDSSCLTVCCLTLKNGFTVSGESACASPENFNKELGQKIAKENARNKIWMLEGYLLKQKLFSEPSNYQERVIKEKDELQEKIDKLKGFIDSDSIKKLDDANCHALLEQYEVMIDYRDILLARIDLFDFTGDE